MGSSVEDRGPNHPMFDRPFIDTDEWRLDPVRHRFLHGGFEGTDVRFAIFLLRPPEHYQGRSLKNFLLVTSYRIRSASRGR